MDERIAKLAEDATAGLKDDPELRLDVRAEMESHIEESARNFAAEGKSDEESTELALKSFGSPLEIAADLLEANKKRMKLRALARMAVRALLVPAALVVALLVVANPASLNPPGIVIGDKDNPAGATVAYPKPAPWSSPRERKRIARLRFLVEGDRSRPTPALRQRAIWEKYPTRPHFANYALSLFGEPIRNTRQLAHFEQEMQLGRKLDPENALYDYLLAGGLLNYPAEAKSRRGASSPAFVTRNRPLFERSMSEFLKGTAKPRCETYSPEIAREMQGLLPPKTRLSMSALSVILPPAAVPTRQLLRGALFEARGLAERGRGREAQRYLDSWYPVMMQTARNAHGLLDILIASAFSAMAERQFAPVYEQIGRKDLADRTRQLARRITSPAIKAKLQLGGRTKLSEKESDLLKQKGGMLVSIVASAIGARYFPESELAPMRNAEQIVFLEEMPSIFLVIGFLALMARAFLIALRLRRDPEAQSAPLLLLPGLKTFARIFLLSIILPVGLYMIYTRIPGLSGREYAISYLWPRFLAEAAIVATALAVLPGMLTARVLRRRCRELGIAVPDPRAERRARVLSVIGALVWWIGIAFAMGFALDFDSGGPWSCLYALGIALVLAGSALLPRWLKRGRKCELYYATIARSLIPIYATAILLLGGIGYPLLVKQEKQWVMSDRLFMPSPAAPGITSAEARYVQDIKALMLKAAE